MTQKNTARTKNMLLRISVIMLSLDAKGTNDAGALDHGKYFFFAGVRLHGDGRRQKKQNGLHVLAGREHRFRHVDEPCVVFLHGNNDERRFPRPQRFGVQEQIVRRRNRYHCRRQRRARPDVQQSGDHRPVARFFVGRLYGVRLSDQKRTAAALRADRRFIPVVGVLFVHSRLSVRRHLYRFERLDGDQHL